jgi:uncharacterized protein (TIGR00369 family)
MFVMKRVTEIFRSAPFIQLLGIRCESVRENECVAVLDISAHHLQHLGIVHGGVITTLAGHAAAGAATSVLTDSEYVVASRFDAHLVASSREGQLRACARVIETTAKGFVVEALVQNQLPGGMREVGKLTFHLARRG